MKNITKTKKQIATKEPAPEIKSTAVLPYFKGLSEALRRCLNSKAYGQFSDLTQHLDTGVPFIIYPVFSRKLTWYFVGVYIIIYHAFLLFQFVFSHRSVNWGIVITVTCQNATITRVMDQHPIQSR